MDALINVFEYLCLRDENNPEKHPAVRKVKQSGYNEQVCAGH